MRCKMPLNTIPIAGPGNGVVNIFDMDGNFVRRFATGGALNAPWGITQASANFGPFSNNIVIGNAGDGNINAFDLATGNFVGKLKDGDGHAIVETGLHGLAFRSDGFGDPDTLYFTSQINNEDDGLFGAITTGLVTQLEYLLQTLLLTQAPRLRPPLQLRPITWVLRPAQSLSWMARIR